MCKDSASVTPVVGVLILSAGPFCLYGCAPSVPGDGGEQKVAEYVFSDLTDGLTGEIDFSTGDHALIYGTRHDDATLANLEAIGLLNEQTRTFTEVHFNEDGLPVRIIGDGGSWDIVWSQTENGDLRTTLTHNDQSIDLDLAPEAEELVELLLSDSLATSPSARGFNRVTALGAVSMGLGLAGFIGLAAAATPIAVGASVVGIIAGTAGGAMTIGQSLSDRPPMPHEERISNALTLLSLSSGATSLVGSTANISAGVAVSVSDRLGVVGLAVDLATVEQSDLLDATSAAHNQACDGNPECQEGSIGDGTSGEQNPCCVATDNCPSETFDSCPGSCCCCDVGQVCVNSVCSGASGAKTSTFGGILLNGGGPELKRAITREQRE